MVFKKGQTGNPNGQPKIPEEVKKAFLERSMEAFETLVRLMRSAEEEDLRFKAAQAILDRGIGKAKESIEHSLDPVQAAQFVFSARPLSALDWEKTYTIDHDDSKEEN